MQAQEVTPIPPIASSADFVEVHFKARVSSLPLPNYSTAHNIPQTTFSITLIIVRAQHLIDMH